MKVEVIEPHGMCAGVHAAIAKALKLKNVWCLHELVHNEIVIGELKDLGFRFVENIEDVPVGETVVFSAHGVPPRVREIAKERRLNVVDTTCPFVAKVHREARAFAERGLPVVIIGDPKHAEVKGIAGEVEEVGGGRLEVEQRTDKYSSVQHPTSNLQPRTKIGVVSQTTMNADEVAKRVEELRKDYDIETMAEVCNATKERQDAVRRFCISQTVGRVAPRIAPASQLASLGGYPRPPHSQMNGGLHCGGNAAAKGLAALPPPVAVLVLGSRTSSNSKRLAEVAEACGARAFLAGNMDELKAIDFTGVETLGVTSGASTPERFFMEAIKHLRNVPEHVAIIMDGNGRWATQRGKVRGEGHIAGAKTLEKVLNWCGERDIRYLTVYAFSTENWKRPKAEVDGLMKLFVRMLKSKTKDFIRNKVRFRMVGRRGDLSAKLLAEITRLEDVTKEFSRQFIVAISYGGRAEIIDAVNAAMAKGEPLTEETFRKFLYAPDVPDPDLVIRTSGEIRTSNFLLWETAYSEYYFTDTLWPDFSEADLDAALTEYANRHRRKGGV